jgi:hypothetical protein
MQLRKILPLFLVCTIACGAEAPDIEIAAMSTSQAIQNGQAPHFAVANAPADQPWLRASGMIAVPMLDEQHIQKSVSNIPLRETCGVTFISPHYALTAAHCVNDINVWDPRSQSFTVTSYDVSQIPWTTMKASFEVPKTRGNFFPYYKRPLLTTGYVTTSTECQVVRRCGGGLLAIDYACPVSKGVDPDVALLHCGAREQSDFIPLAENDPQEGPVEMYWHQEVMNLPTEKAPNADLFDADRFEHYAIIPWFNAAAHKENNFHYFDSPTNQILPLRATPWHNEHAMPRMRVKTWDTTVFTDLYGCQGTDGSGVLQRTSEGKLELLGPVTTMGAGFDTGYDDPRFCSDTSKIGPGSSILGYPMLRLTKEVIAGIVLD